MAFEIYDTHELMGVIETFPPVSSFWLDTFYPRSFFSDSQWIDFEEVAKGRRLAPYVAPNVQGQPMLQRAEAIKRFKVAYLKPKDPVDPARLLKRRPGESLGSGSLSMAEREDAIIADILGDHDDMIRRRWDVMGCHAVKNGFLVIEGDNYPTRTIGFGRRPDHTVTLTGTARWGQAGADPLGNLKSWNTKLQRAGTKGARLIMDPSASEGFFGDVKVQKMLETRRGSTVALQSYNIDGGPVTYHGSMDGVELFTYSDFYEDNQGNEIPYMDEGEVILAGNVDGVRCFGAIFDRKANWAAQALFPKMWEADDPSGLFLMTQSAPLMVPARPNGAVKANVL